MQEAVIYSEGFENCAQDYEVFVWIVSTVDSFTATRQWCYNRRSELVGATGSQTHFL